MDSDKLMHELNDHVANDDRVLYMDGEQGNFRLKRVYRNDGSHMCVFRCDSEAVLGLMDNSKWFVNGKPLTELSGNSAQ